MKCIFQFIWALLNCIIVQNLFTKCKLKCLIYVVILQRLDSIVTNSPAMLKVHIPFLVLFKSFPLFENAIIYNVGNTLILLTVIYMQHVLHIFVVQEIYIIALANQSLLLIMFRKIFNRKVTILQVTPFICSRSDSWTTFCGKREMPHQCKVSQEH